MQVKFCVLQPAFFSLKFVVTVSVSSSYEIVSLFDSAFASASITITSSQIIAESSMKYFPFLQLHVAEFQT